MLLGCSKSPHGRSWRPSWRRPRGVLATLELKSSDVESRLHVAKVLDVQTWEFLNIGMPLGTLGACLYMYTNTVEIKKHYRGSDLESGDRFANLPHEF